MQLSHIYARSENRVIGRDGGIPWRLPDDFAHFKRTTMGRPIIMGRRTYEDHESALPGRLNIVVSRDADYKAADGVVLAPSLEDAIARAKNLDPSQRTGGREVGLVAYEPGRGEHDDQEWGHGEEATNQRGRHEERAAFDEAFDALGQL